MPCFVHFWHPWNVLSCCTFQGCYVLLIPGIPEICSRIARFRDAIWFTSTSGGCSRHWFRRPVRRMFGALILRTVLFYAVFCLFWHPWNVQQDCAFQGCHVLFISGIPELVAVLLHISGMLCFVNFRHPWNVQQNCAFQGYHVLFISGIPEMCSPAAHFRDAMFC